MEECNKQKVVIALGGNALQTRDSDGTAGSQLEVIRKTAEHIADISAAGFEIAIVHGNGPQIGQILLSSETASDVTPVMPFDVCGAMSQGYIGYQMQQALKYALNWRNLNIPVVSITTQMVVDEKDHAFTNPTKPIGTFYSKEKAESLSSEKGCIYKEDSGKGYRRVVASPKPVKIVEIDSIKRLWESTIVITCGGGGIPVREKENGVIEGIPAVIDKDFAAELLAEEVEADVLLILTECEVVSINYQTENQTDVREMSLNDAIRYIEEKQFSPGGMLPKVESAMKFVRAYPEKKAIITSMDKALEALQGKTGTVIKFNHQ